MFEMPSNHNNDTPITLDVDCKAASCNELQAAIDALKFIKDFISSDSLTVDARFNGLSVAVRHLQKAKTLLGSDEDDAQTRENDLRLLRAANQENLRLRQEMAKGVTSEAVGHKLYDFKNTIVSWWQNLGFSYLTGHFDSYGNGGFCSVEFRTSIDKNGDFLYEEKPVTEKKKKEKKIEDLSEVLDLFKLNSDVYVVDNEKNRAWIISQLVARFPSIRIYEFISGVGGRSGIFQIKTIKASIDVKEIEEVDA